MAARLQGWLACGCTHSGLRPSAAGLSRRVLQAGLRPHYSGLRPPAMGARTSFLFGEFLLNLKTRYRPKALIYK